MDSVSKLSNVSKVSKLSNMSRCYTSNSSKIIVN